MAELEPDPVAAIEQVPPHGGEAEAPIHSLRARIGMVLAPLLFTIILLLDFPSLEPQAHRLAAIMAAVVVFWITEALPMPVTALVGAAACVVMRVAPAKEVFAPFADPLMFLFIGAFMIAQGIFVHGLDRRLAFGVLSLEWVGGRPSRILFAYGAVTCFISAWISNTATTAMMFAIGLSILAMLSKQEQQGGVRINRGFATGLMLMTSFAASIGGLATPIGTPPNLIGLGLIKETLGIEFPFFKWMMLGVPVVAVLFGLMYLYMNRLSPAGVRVIEGHHELLRRERDRLGGWTAGQVSTVIACAVTVVLWITPGVIALTAGEQSAAFKWVSQIVPEAVPALLGASLLFILPGGAGKRALTWQQAVRIDWGVVLLYGGGFALGVLAAQTGLARAIGKGLTAQLPLEGGLTLLIASTIVAALLSETTSNTAAVNIIVPVVIAVATEIGADPLEPALGATLGASMGFMLPVSTPCNAIVYGSGHIPLGKMIRYGALLDVIGVCVIIVFVHFLVPLLR